MRLSISEILKRADAAPTKEEKMYILKTNESDALAYVLQCCFDYRVKWLLPAATPTYTPAKYTDIEGRLYQETKHFYLFTEEGNPNLKPEKRLNIFVQMLESVTPDDAKLLIDMKDKTCSYKSITPELVNEVWPGLIMFDPNKETTKEEKRGKKMERTKDEPRQEELAKTN